MNQQFYKNLALWVVILVVMLLLFTTLRQNESPVPNIPFSEFMEMVETNQVESITIEEGHIAGEYADGRKFTAPRVDWRPSKGTFAYRRRLIFRFVPTGGVNLANAPSYAALPEVAAVGGERGGVHVRLGPAAGGEGGPGGRSTMRTVSVKATCKSS